MTQLSRLAVLGIAKESTAGTYVVPASYIPFTKADYEDITAPIKDQSYRANDSVVQGVYGGPIEADWSIDLLAYPDLLGHFMRAIIGPDTVTAAASTTTSGSSSVGATTITVASATGITTGTYISIDVGANQEYAYVSNVVSTTLTVTSVQGSAVGLLKAHNTGVAVTTQTTHTFKQNPAVARATYSLSVFDTLSVAAATRGYTYTAFSDVQLKIDPKGACTLSTKAKAQQGVQQSAITPTFTALPPLLGWQWTMTQNAVSSTRGLTFDVTIKRAVEAIHSSNGVQSPREIFQGALEIDGTYKAIFENTTDLDLFTNYTQAPTVATLQQPVAAGGASLALTMSVSSWNKGKRDFAPAYVQADFSIEGIYNATDAGSVSAVLKNFVTSAY